MLILENLEMAIKSLNTKFHESNAVFTKDGQTIYYTSNNYFNKKYKKVNEINKLKIFRLVKQKTDGEYRRTSNQ
ncbi:hypothetical protein BST93_00525 [Nonlabens tegetincola]|nr:hypothetical protein BST93_00525 [Nonlabens tegetincola]